MIKKNDNEKIHYVRIYCIASRWRIYHKADRIIRMTEDSSDYQFAHRSSVTSSCSECHVGFSWRKFFRKSLVICAIIVQQNNTDIFFLLNFVFVQIYKELKSDRVPPPAMTSPRGLMTSPVTRFYRRGPSSEIGKDFSAYAAVTLVYIRII